MRVFGASQNIDQAIDKHMTADLRPDIDLADDISSRIKLENALLVPLAQVQLIPRS